MDMGFGIFVDPLKKIIASVLSKLLWNEKCFHSFSSFAGSSLFCISSNNTLPDENCPCFQIIQKHKHIKVRSFVQWQRVQLTDVLSFFLHNYIKFYLILYLSVENPVICLKITGFVL